MERERWGTLERVPRTPQNFSRIILLSGIGTVARFRAFLIFLSRRLQGGWRAAPVPGGGVPSAVACPLGRSPILPFTYFPAPSPRPPSPPGKGVPKVYFAGGFAPGTPALNRLRHLQILPYRCLAGSWLFCNTGFRRPGKAPRLGFQRAMPVPRPFSPRGCKGRSPLHEITLIPPSRREGGGGMGQKRNLKAG